MLTLLLAFFGLSLFLQGWSYDGSFDNDSYENVAIYWGQSATTSLADFCARDEGDIYILAFVSAFGTGDDSDGYPVINFAGNCNDVFSEDSSLLDCPAIGEGIKACQAAGKKVLLSLGGAAGTYGFTSSDEATETAETLWKMFGNANDTDTLRPFGDAVIDGFDLDIEEYTNDVDLYGTFSAALRGWFNTDTSKSYYLSAAPQCPFTYLSWYQPDQSFLVMAEFDFLFVQFYNNYPCNVGYQCFNFEAWSDFVTTYTPNTKIYLGLPSSSDAAGSGYLSDEDLLIATINELSAHFSTFGGVMLWDAARSENNGDYASLIQSVLGAASTYVGGTASFSTTASTAESCDATSFTNYLTGYSTVTVPSYSALPTIGASATKDSSKTTSKSSTKTTATSSVKATTKTASTSTTDSGEGKGVSIISVSLPSDASTSVTSKSTSSTPTATSTSTPTSSASGSSSSSSCASGEVGCFDGKFGICNFGSWVLTACGSGTTCKEESGTAVCDYA